MYVLAERRIGVECTTSYLNPAVVNSKMSEGSIPLTAVQSVTLHGWLTPKRMLSWKDVCASKSITPALCSSCGIDDELLYLLQPSLHLWIEMCGVSFKDVRYMTRWPLHPFQDLGGYIPDLIENHYEASLLHKLGIDYQLLTDRNMTVEWMKMFKYSERDWALLGFNAHHVSM